MSDMSGMKGLSGMGAGNGANRRAALVNGWRAVFIGLFIAIAVGFTGCEFLRDAGLLPGEEEPTPAPGGGWQERAPTSLKVVFGIETARTEGVTDTFTVVSRYIAEGGLNESPSRIKLGDWIDLEGGLKVDPYMVGNYTGGEIDITSNPYVDPTDPGKSKLLRLIVVGINSFEETNDDAPSHVVFQFQNIPGTQKMGTDNAEQGYRGSIVWTYLPDNMYFLKGLTDAGVPQEVLWTPSRYAGQRMDVGVEAPAQTLSDELWLPTKWELYGPDDTANGNGFEETETNQARLEYYKDHSERLIKYDVNGDPTAYWTASQGADGSTLQYFFVSDDGEIKVDGTRAGFQTPLGVAPAFCVKGPEVSE